MSSLGDLLLGKAHDKSSGHDSDDNEDDKFYSVQRSQALAKESSNAKAPPEDKKVTGDNDDDDAKSNASSTDDYVRELLDPNDRPRNVWHVVEGPKSSSFPNDEDVHDYERQRTLAGENMRVDSKSPNLNEAGRDRQEIRYPPPPLECNLEDSIPPPPTPPPPEDTDALEGEPKSLPEQDWEQRTSSSHKSEGRRHHDREGKSDRDRSKDKSPSSRRHHKSDRDRSSRHQDYDRRHSRNRDRSRDRDYDRRDRSHRKSSTSRRRYDISDDEEDYERRRGGRQHHRRSRSRSRSSSRRTRSRRSRSNSQSPITRRNSRTVLLMQLSQRVTSRDLEEFFSEIGHVREVRLIMDSKTRRHKGIAYIEFEDTTSASKALALNGQKFFGAPMSIQSALTDRSKGDWGGITSSSTGHYSTSHSSSRVNLPPDCFRVYVGSLHTGINEEMLRSLFEPFGPIIRLELMRDRTTGLSRGYAFITFANIEDGQYAVESLDGLELGGKCIRVSKSTEKGEQQQHSSSSLHV